MDNETRKQFKRALEIINHFKRKEPSVKAPVRMSSSPVWGRIKKESDENE